MPLLSIYCENTCILCHSFHQNDNFRMMGHATKLTFCNKIFFFAEFKFVYKASLIICLHKYVNNSIYVFEPKFTKSRPMLSLNSFPLNDDIWRPYVYPSGMRIFSGSAKSRGFCLTRTDLVNRPDPLRYFWTNIGGWVSLFPMINSSESAYFVA